MERELSHIFPCSPQRGKISQLDPTCCIGITILGGIYPVTVRIKLENNSKHLRVKAGVWDK